MREQRPWGYYDVLFEGPGLKAKKITVQPGGKLSMQRHQYRDEFWMFTHGIGLMTHDEVSMVFPGEYHYISAGDIHRIENPSSISDLVFFEIQLGKILDENDIERISDVYGRK